jgi:chemotaxis protein CheC
LTPEQEDILTELVNVGIGRAACSLSEMIDSNVGLRVPNVRAADARGMIQLTDERHADSSIVVQGFTGPLAGTAVLVFPPASARSLVALLTGAQKGSLALDVERAAVLTEVGNIIINAVLGSLGNLASLDLTFGLPRYEEGGALTGLDPTSQAWAVVVGVVFQIKEHSVEGQLAVVFERATLGSVWRLMAPTGEPAIEASA